MTVNKPYDVVAIGNAILDILAFTTDDFIAEQGMHKGAMQLIDDKRAAELYDKMAQTQEVSGGSAANTLAGMASLGARVSFIGKVKNDQFGAIYRHDLRAVGVEFLTPPNSDGAPTGCSYILVTPDAERTMNTYLGAGSDVHEDDVPAELMAQTKVIYGEGYQWCNEGNKRALRKAFDLTKAAGGKVAFTLSDLFCVKAYREEFLELIAGTFDILFANEAEAQALYPDLPFNEVLDQLQGQAELVVVTRGHKGSLIMTRDERITVDAIWVDELVDTTGAGDLYAAGFLYGYVKNLPLAECGRLGSACAAAIIQQIGARALKPLAELVKQ